MELKQEKLMSLTSIPNAIIPTPQTPRFIDNARTLMRLAGPLIMGQIAVVGMTVTDIYVAGQVNADTLAALQLGGSIWSMITLMVIGIMIANSPIIGNYWGCLLCTTDSADDTLRVDLRGRRTIDKTKPKLPHTRRV